MVRSLSFIHLFIILAVGYIGGALLFREIPSEAVERWIAFYDARVVEGREAGVIRPIGALVSFYIVAYVFARIRQTRPLVLFTGALKSVFFGLASSYLLGSGMKMLDYTVWWFPFQFASCFLFLLYCAVLRPPYFMQSTIGKRRNPRALPILLFLSACVLLGEMAIYYWILR
ncbi:hypothetical protein AB1K83_13720 [Sporosarcina sp. 179-K 3D1 HS]|uniref:hypothetical protein n=1 Tax=Sporosarcina sp. 179-K 3D1 HS TaxID=3232169 RepID=UPI0039A2B823